MTKNELLFFCHYVNFLFQNGDNYPDTKIIRILCIIDEREYGKYFFLEIFPFLLLLVTYERETHNKCPNNRCITVFTIDCITCDKRVLQGDRID